MPDSTLRQTLLRIAKVIGTEQQSRMSEEEVIELVEQWAQLCPHPGGTDILFWPNELGLCKWDEVGTFQMSPEAMVDYALSWEPRTVAMRVSQRTGGGSIGYYCYTLEAPDTPKTQVVTPLDTLYQPGDVLAVALKGVQLSDGTQVTTTYDLGAMSCGKILGPSEHPVGTQLKVDGTPR